MEQVRARCLLPIYWLPDPLGNLSLTGYSEKTKIPNEQMLPPSEEQARDAPAGDRHNRASTIIQRAFRRFINVRVYKYYRNLVSFRNRGDPGSVPFRRCLPASVAGRSRLLLRCMNPSEALQISG